MVFKMLKGHIKSNCNRKGIVGGGGAIYLIVVKLNSISMKSVIL